MLTTTCSATPAPSPEPGFPANAIRRTQTIEWTVEHIPFGDPPTRDGNWVGCLVPAREFSRNTSQLQHSHVHVVGRRPDSKYHVAVSQHYLPQLRSHVSLELYTAKPCIDVHDGEVGVYGIHEANERARRRLCNALDGIAMHGAGLGRFYRGHILDARSGVMIEHAILTREIGVLHSNRDRFWQTCVFISLHLVRDTYGKAAYEVMDRDDDVWMKIIRRPTAEPYFPGGQDLSMAALLRAVFEYAEGTTDTSQHQFDEERSVNDNLETFGRLFDVDLEVTEFCGFGDPAVSEALLWHKPFECGLEDVIALEESFPDRPIAFQRELYQTLPPAIINALPYNAVCAFQVEMRRMYEQASWLKADTENDLQVLLCYCIKEELFPAICDWADGRLWYQQTTMRLHGSGSPEQVALTVTALHSYEWFAGLGNKTLAVTSYSYLVDFVQKEMAMKGFEKRRQAWKDMAESIREFLGENYMPRSFTDSVFTEELPRHWSRGLVEMYRICAGDDSWVLV